MIEQNLQGYFYHILLILDTGQILNHSASPWCSSQNLNACMHHQCDSEDGKVSPRSADTNVTAWAPMCT